MVKKLNSKENEELDELSKDKTIATIISLQPSFTQAYLMLLPLTILQDLESCLLEEKKLK